MNNKFKKVVVGITMGAMLVTGAAFAADEPYLGKNMTGAGVGQGVTKFVIADFLMMDPFAIRAERRAGLSYVEIAENQGLSGTDLIATVVASKEAIAPETCTEEDIVEKVTANMNKAPQPKSQAIQKRELAGEQSGAAVTGQMKGQARGWQR